MTLRPITNPFHIPVRSTPLRNLTRLVLAAGAALTLSAAQAENDAFPKINASTGLQTQQPVKVQSSGGYYQQLFYNYTTSQLSLSPTLNTPSDVLYSLPDYNQWFGVFHYDYTAGYFSETVSLLRQAM